MSSIKHPMQLIYEGLLASDNLPDIEPGDVAGVCQVTGMHDDRCLPVENVMSKSFTDWQRCHGPKSGLVSYPAACCLKQGLLRKKWWIAHCDGIIWIEKSYEVKPGTTARSGDLARMLLNYDLPFPCVIGVGSSGKKHMSIRATVSTAGKIVVQWEEERALVDRPLARELWKMLLPNYTGQGGLFTKSDFETLLPGMKRIEKYGIENWSKPATALRSHYQSALYRLLVYALWTEKNEPST